MPTPMRRSLIVSPPVFVNSTSTVFIGCAANGSSANGDGNDSSVDSVDDELVNPSVVPPPACPSESLGPPLLAAPPTLSTVNVVSLESLFDSAIAASEYS